MARVAERTGSATMSLYRHVRNKDDLVALMLEAAVGVPTAPDRAASGWRVRLEQWAVDLLAVVRRHPWALDLPLARLPIGPPIFAVVSVALAWVAVTRLARRS